MASKTTLQTIIDRYCGQEYNEDNYSVGGGLDSCKFASNRHEDAKYDAGKLTLGEATQLFKKATGMDTDAVREVLEYAVPHFDSTYKSYNMTEYFSGWQFETEEKYQEFMALK